MPAHLLRKSVQQGERKGGFRFQERKLVGTRRGSWRGRHSLLCGATGYCSLGSQVLREPVGRGRRRALELVGIGREVTAGVELQPLGLAGAVERRQTEVSGTDDVGVAEHHEEGGGGDALDECAGLVLRVHFERAQRDLVAPLLKPPSVLLRSVLAAEEVPRVRTRV